MAATAILTTKIAEAAVIIVAEFIVVVPSSEAEPSYEVALLSEAEQDIEEPTLLTIVPADAVGNLWEPGAVGAPARLFRDQRLEACQVAWVSGVGVPKTSRPLKDALIWSLVELFGLTPELL